jgi:hypothetical protein
MSIWIAVSLLNKERLVQLAQASVESATVAEPAFAIVQLEHSAYYVMDTLGTMLFGDARWEQSKVQGPYSRLCISQRTELCPGCSARQVCCRVVVVTVEDEEMVNSARSRRCTVPAPNRACDRNPHTQHFLRSAWRYLVKCVCL